MLKEKCKNQFNLENDQMCIIGPFSIEIDSIDLETVDGVHFNYFSKELIAKKIINEIIKNYFRSDHIHKREEI